MINSGSERVNENISVTRLFLKDNSHTAPNQISEQLKTILKMCRNNLQIYKEKHKLEAEPTHNIRTKLRSSRIHYIIL